MDSVKINRILEALRYGSGDDKLKAITLARRKVNESLFGLVLGESDVKQLVKETLVTDPFSTDELEELRSGLREVLASRKDMLACWYAIITLVDFGDLSIECLENLMSTSPQVISWLAQTGEAEGESAVVAGFMEFEVQKETIRALSRFKDSPIAGGIIKECFEGKHLLGRQESGGLEVLRESAFYAFGAIGNSEYRGLVEYWAQRAEKDEERKAAKAALALWGQADYDGIVEHAEKEKADKKGFFKKLFG
jgi:hypothetical protein